MFVNLTLALQSRSQINASKLNIMISLTSFTFVVGTSGIFVFF